MYLVTGGAGFIGSHLIGRLLQSGNKVICVDDLSTGYIKYLPEDKLLTFVNKKIQVVSIRDLKLEIDGIFHLAAQASVPVSINNFFKSSKNNLMGMLKVWEIANEMKVPVVYASSSAVYGNLCLGDDQSRQVDILSPYAQDKLTMEHYAKMCWEVYKTPSMGLRFFNVYGPRQDPTNPYSGVISIFIDRLLNKAPVTINGGYQTRDFINVKDIVNVLVKSMGLVRRQKCCNTLNVGTGRSVTIDKLLSIISEIFNISPEIILKDLSPGDPKQSDGIYGKLKQVLKTDTKDFTDLKTGLLATINSIKLENTN